MSNDDGTNSMLISHRAFSIPLILEKIFSYILLKKDILPSCLVNRWWNQLATERLWYKFQGLRNDLRTQSFSKFLEVLKQSNLYYNDQIKHADKRCFHQYGRYVKILDLEKLEISHEKLLETLDCCPRIEQLSLGNRSSNKLNETQLYDIAKRLPELKSFKFNEIDINNGKALGAVANFCLKLEELNLKKDIFCDSEVLLDITRNCKKLIKLDIEEKCYEDEIMLSCLSNCPSLTFLKIHQCISISESFLLNIYRSCPGLTNVTITNVSNITTKFAIETFKHFRKVKTLSICSVNRPLESKIQANEQLINVELCKEYLDLGRIIEYFKSDNNNDDHDEKKQSHLLRELTLVDIPSLNKIILGIICKGLDQLTKLELHGVKEDLSKSDVLEIIPSSKTISHFLIKFSFPTDSLLNEDKDRLFKECSQLKFIQWQLLRYERSDQEQ